ncbi:aspartyl-phosphate phosphatase Spo0E family protein [Bacillus sp. Marseille-P3661]|uniref:aspartyl-phosphate phosphatase Spo0E family protein n=1 Tax=Bacillus sp. Marseille-P3661 TaxID=1936234 RepID=UPI000C837169|nr:aspartyl-phosphate phosphatase Spo0E family protein [Bacillus sp. Marseille-P3661]
MELGSITNVIRKQIEVKRKEMIELASVHGINSLLTVQCSQELDRLLNHLDRQLYKRRTA